MLQSFLKCIEVRFWSEASFLSQFPAQPVPYPPRSSNPPLGFRNISNPAGILWMKTTVNSFTSPRQRWQHSSVLGTSLSWGPARRMISSENKRPLQTPPPSALGVRHTLTPVSINQEQSVCGNLCPLHIMHWVYAVYITLLCACVQM